MARAIFDPFQALGLPRDASEDAIKTRYHALARKYHPNRTIQTASDAAKANLAERFQRIHEAWKLLSNPGDRKRRVELLKLLELQHDIESHFSDLLAAGTPEDEHADQSGHLEHQSGSELDGHVSSDADEDLPSMGLHRRQTFLSRDGQLGGRRTSVDSDSPTTPTRKKSKWHILKPANERPSSRGDTRKEEDYFTARRKKLEKLRKKELVAFENYRDAMIAKFNAEEEAERHLEHYERARWRRDYLERAPRGTSERMRSFQQFMGAVTAFERHAPRQRNRSTLSYSVASPVVGPGEGPQFLNPDHALSRQKSIHRRGWSSDISADQTDSSEEEPGEVHGIKRGSHTGHWRHHSKIHREHSFEPRGSTGDSYQGTDFPTQSTGPFRLVVRQPTDLGTIVEAHDSSSETVSKSSRSPSPLPENKRFIMLRGSVTADMFGVSPEPRARSPSPGTHRRQPVSPKKQRDHSPSSGEGMQFATKYVGIPQHQTIPYANVHLLPRAQKFLMLGAERDTEPDAGPVVLLARLRQLNTSVAEKFEVKPNMEQVFNFRLIYGHREVAPKQHQSFIALSYRRKLVVESHQHHFTLPLEAEIFQAVWDERQSDTEGVWIDQICINQDSDEERTVSMSAMDLVYRSARVVVVALDDILLEAHEGELLQTHMDEYNHMTHVPPRQRFRHKQPPYLDSHDNLYKVVRKILSSSWFQRAWCRHEMRLSKHLVFLLPCTRAASLPGIDVLRFNSKCIAHLLDLSTEVPFESVVESVKPALHAFFRDRSKMAPDERQMALHHGNFSSVVAEVFAMEAGGDPRISPEKRQSDARKDKISIILNTMECGLALKGLFRKDGWYGANEECFHDLTLLALAARDPGALCSVGPALPISDSCSSWLHVPTVVDAGLNNTKTLQRLPDDIQLATCTTGENQFLQIDMKFLGGREVHRPQLDPEVVRLALLFTEVCTEKKWGRHRKQYLIFDRKMNRLFGNMKEVYVETLACVFHCGPDWMSDVCQRYSMSRWKVDLRGAYELLIALQNTHGNWPVEAWNERAASFLMDFVNFLVIRGLPRRQISQPEPWRPLWVQTPAGGKVLTFGPIKDHNIHPAVPIDLTNADYVHLARLWLLKPRSAEHDREYVGTDADISEWTLLGKSVLFSDELSIAGMTVYSADYKERQKIYGRRRESTTATMTTTTPTRMNGLLRDRSPN